MAKQEFVSVSRQPLDSAEPRPEAVPTVPTYRSPHRFVLGKAADLVRNSGSGHLRDGNGGWYVWGS